MAFLSGGKSNVCQKPKPSGKSMTGNQVLQERHHYVGLCCPTGFSQKPWRRICNKTKLESVLFVMSESMGGSIDRTFPRDQEIRRVSV